MEHLRAWLKVVLQVRHMQPEHAQYFLTYLAQGIGRVGKDYLKSSAAQLLSMRELQLFSNLLPEFGSLPWALKPVIVLLIERTAPATRQLALVTAVAVTAMPWFFLSVYPPMPMMLLLATGLASLGSAVVDGLTDGRLAAESTEASAAALQSLCQTGYSIGAFLVGFAAWALELPTQLSLMVTAAAWASILVALRPTRSQQEPGADADWRPFAWRELAKPNILCVAVLGFAVCLAPAADTFLYRQFVLGLKSSQQPLVSIAGTVGWFLGTFTYREKIAFGRTATGALRFSLLLWALPLFAKVLLLAVDESLALPAALLENAASEFGKALTFMPTTILQQLHATKGCEGTAFTLMQSGGTLGMVLGRNLEWRLLLWCGIDATEGAVGFSRFPVVIALAALWRILTAAAIIWLLMPQLTQPTEQPRRKEKRDSPAQQLM